MAISPDNLAKLGDLLQEMGLTPNVENADELQKWMKEEVEKKTVKEEVKEKKKEDATIITTHWPKVSNFWGTSGFKEGVSFEVWKYEVECLSKHYKEEEKLEAVRRSLKGEAAKIAMRLGPRAALEDIVFKLEGVFGNVASESTLLTQFFQTSQGEDEDVASYSIRLEDLITVVCQRKLIDARTMDSMLRMRLWSGLKNEGLKQACRMKYEQIPNFEDLVLEIRSMEQEFGLEKNTKEGKSKAKAQMIQKKTGSQDEQVSGKDSRMYLPEEGWKRLEEKLDKLEKDVKDLKTEKQYNGHDRYRGSSRGRYRGSSRGRYRERSRGSYVESSRGRYQEERRDQSDDGQERKSRNTEVICYRCGQEGHIALGCRVRTDHLKNLNEDLPLPGGGH